MMLVKRATMQGASPWTGTLFANLWLALLWSIPALMNWKIAPTAAWGQAAIIGGLFVLGQIFTYLAFQYGDVSVATPVFGVKVLIVALCGLLMAGEAIPYRIWIAACLAAGGVAFVQFTGRRPGPGGKTTADRRGLTIGMVLLSGVALSLFDILLQMWGTRWNSREFLPVVFAATAGFSLLLVPWVDRPAVLHRKGILGWMLIGTFMMAVQAMSMSYALGTWGDATRVNIVYSLRGLWGVSLSWILARWFGANEAFLAPTTMLMRFVGAVLLTAAVITAIGR